MINNKNPKTKKITNKDIERIVLKLSNFYNKKEVAAWGKYIIKKINNLFEKYSVTDFEVNKNSYMGIVIECNSSKYGLIYIKAVPPMIKRFETEIRTLKALPENLVCKFYEVNYNDKIVVMEKVIPGDLVEFYPNKRILSRLFDELYKYKTEINDSNTEYKDFSEVVARDYKICKENKYSNKTIDTLYKIFCKKYKKISSGQTKYLLHGDAYKNNILLSKNKAKLIDPLGFVAPFVFELVSICSYEMFYNDKNNKEILKDFIKFFNKYSDEKTYKDALFCQLVKLYIPSTYEANDGGVRATKWLNIIKELYPEALK